MARVKQRKVGGHRPWWSVLDTEQRDFMRNYRRARRTAVTGTARVGRGIAGYEDTSQHAGRARTHRYPFLTPLRKREPDRANPHGERKRKPPGNGGKRKRGRRWEGGS